MQKALCQNRSNSIKKSIKNSADVKDNGKKYTADASTWGIGFVILTELLIRYLFYKNFYKQSMISVSKSLAITIGAMLLIPISVFAEDVTPTPTTTEVAPTSATGGEVSLPRPTLRTRIATTTRLGVPPRVETLRTMASGTRPLPKDLEERAQGRAQIQDCIGGASTTDCLQGREERRTEARARMEEKRSEILKRVSLQMFERMQAAIDRFTKLSDRIDSRIQKLKEQGVDTTKSEGLMKITRAKIADASTALEVAKQKVDGAALVADSSASSTEPVDAGKPVRENLEKARTAIMDAHKALVDAVESLKASSALRVRQAPATSTEATTTL